MKNELVLSIITAVAGVLIAFFVCNLFIGDIQPVSVKTVDSSINASLTEPDPEIFNNQALNPTVEVYIGSCTEYNALGECIDQVTEEELDNTNIQGEEQSGEEQNESENQTNQSNQSEESNNNSSNEGSNSSVPTDPETFDGNTQGNS